MQSMIHKCQAMGQISLKTNTTTTTATTQLNNKSNSTRNRNRNRINENALIYEEVIIDGREIVRESEMR